ncbi:MAG: transporter substrate-binding domain-containing protein [Gammaproteobacteria bacterium]|nr:transporter substrate-binding domain-containing protein [Gammaproteobacteria bacterium]
MDRPGPHPLAPRPPGPVRSGRTLTARALLGLGLWLSAYAVQAGEAPGACPKPLRAAWHEWHPYHYRDGPNLVGSGVEVLKTLAEDTGCRLEFQEIPWSRALDDLARGDVDVVMEALPIATRQAYARFSQGYSPTRICLWTLAVRRQAVPPSLEALVQAHWRLGVTQGYSYGETLDRWLEVYQARGLVETVRRDEQNLAKLADGKIDALLGDWTVIRQRMREARTRGHYACARAFQGTPDGAFMFSRKSVPEALFRRFDQALERMARDGRLRAIQQRYAILPPANPEARLAQ